MSVIVTDLVYLTAAYSIGRYRLGSGWWERGGRGGGDGGGEKGTGEGKGGGDGAGRWAGLATI